MQTAMIPVCRTIDVIDPIKIVAGRDGNRFEYLITANELTVSKDPGAVPLHWVYFFSKNKSYFDTNKYRFGKTLFLNFI